MNRLELRTAARSILNEEVASFWTDTELNEWLNWAIRDLSAMVRVESNGSMTGTTTAGTVTLAGVARVVAVRCNGLPVKLVNMLEVVGSAADLSAAGTPLRYYLTIDAATGTMVLNWYPAPDNAYPYTIYVVNALGDMTTDSQVPAIPARHHHRLLSKVLSQAYAKGGRDYGASTGFESAWQNDLRIIAADLMNTSEEGYTIRYVDAQTQRPYNPLE